MAATANLPKLITAMLAGNRDLSDLDNLGRALKERKIEHTVHPMQHVTIVHLPQAHFDLAFARRDGSYMCAFRPDSAAEKGVAVA